LIGSENLARIKDTGRTSARWHLFIFRALNVRPFG
jgi:hypothetical protein